MSRPLTPSERWYWLADQFSPLIGGLHLVIEGDTTREQIAEALTALQNEYRVLDSTITLNDKEEPELRLRKRIPLPLTWQTVAIETLTEKQIDEVINGEINTPIDLTKFPPARCHVLEVMKQDQAIARRHVFLTISHALADGRSFAILAMRFLSNLESLANGRPLEQSTKPHDAVLRAGAEAHFPKHYSNAVFSLLKVISYVLRDAIRCIFSKPFRIPCFAPPAATMRHTKILRRQVTREFYLKLKSKYQSESASLHAALYGAVVLALHKIYCTESEPAHIRVGNPVDIRSEFSPQVQQDLGAFVSNVVTYSKVNATTNLWDIARSFGDQAKSAKSNGDIWTVLATLRWLAPKNKKKAPAFIKLLDQQGPSHITLSTVGVLPGMPKSAKVQLISHDFYVAMSVTGAFLMVASVLHEVLHWNFYYVEEFVQKNDAERIAETAMEILEFAVS